jgi:hypothetical protein
MTSPVIGSQAETLGATQRHDLFFFDAGVRVGVVCGREGRYS